MPSLDTMMSYHRLKKAPLDDSEIFTSLVDLMEYCRVGACYTGQRVTVIENDILVEYVIKSNTKIIEENEVTYYVPVIDTKGSELIFKELNFGTSHTPNNGIGLLIYENTENITWNANDTFKFDNDKLCLFSQLEIFKQINTNSFYFVYERISKIDKGMVSKPFAASNVENINDIINSNPDDERIIIMPNAKDDVDIEANYITKLYVMANDYYNALNN